MPLRSSNFDGSAKARTYRAPNPRTCYWGGWGGSLAIIDLDARATVSYVMNRMAPDLLGDQRGLRIAAAAMAALNA